MYGSTRDEGSIGRKRETGMEKRTLVKAVDVGQQRTAGGANAAVQMPVGPNGAVLLQHYASTEDKAEDRTLVPRQDAISMLYYMMRCAALCNRVLTSTVSGDPVSNRDRSDEEVDDPQGDRDHVMEWRQKDNRLRPCVPCCVASVQHRTVSRKISVWLT
ncbi:uncharacterized protein FOBCDRAFT_195098 [Fusarium oxysporum Fo47]|uniref:uncharacterized protein n=1 Tax=Fusarium oxysporum Fo47 TaxID=660027 RepID=UPI00286998F1|nr:uncharacterized protein FOBCDRAFT_195098 [Fusarium oxysporum Fo47]WJG34492.1 hypothetical protein FOBCDRAFT_195098 [Fusarium oxysporum Fo47]